MHTNTGAARRTEAAPLFCGHSDALALAMQQLDEAGFVYRQANTPLTALRHLQDPWKPLTSTLCAPTSRWLEFSAFVRTEHCQLRRIMWADGADAEQVPAVKEGVIDELFCEPWHPHGLYAALGLQLRMTPVSAAGKRCLPRSPPFVRPARLAPRNYVSLTTWAGATEASGRRRTGGS